MPGQMYVDLSRVISLTRLFLIGDYTKSVFKVNNAATNECDRLRAEQAVAFFQLNKRVLLEKLAISLLHVRSLRRHLGDIGNTSSLVQTNILCFTVTQLFPSQGGLDLPATMSGFYVTCNSSMTDFLALHCVIVITYIC